MDQNYRGETRRPVKSLADQIEQLKQEYEIWKQGLPHNKPISYQEWLETEVLSGRSALLWLESRLQMALSTLADEQKDWLTKVNQ
jgi:hypothetical protein